MIVAWKPACSRCRYAVESFHAHASEQFFPYYSLQAAEMEKIGCQIVLMMEKQVPQHNQRDQTVTYCPLHMIDHAFLQLRLTSDTMLSNGWI